MTKKEKHFHPIMITAIVVLSVLFIVFVLIRGEPKEQRASITYAQESLDNMLKASGWEQVCTKTVNVERIDIVGNLDVSCCMGYCDSKTSDKIIEIKNTLCHLECNIDNDTTACRHCVDNEYEKYDEEIRRCDDSCYSMHVENFGEQNQIELNRMGCIRTKVYTFNETHCIEKTLVRSVNENMGQVR